MTWAPFSNLSFWLFGLAPSILGLQELNLPGQVFYQLAASIHWGASRLSGTVRTYLVVSRQQRSGTVCKNIQSFMRVRMTAERKFILKNRFRQKREVHDDETLWVWRWVRGVERGVTVRLLISDLSSGTPLALPPSQLLPQHHLRAPISSSKPRFYFPIVRVRTNQPIMQLFI